LVNLGDMSYVPLHTHSQYSILDSTASVNALAKKAKEYQIPSMALTDSGNMFGAVAFFKACQSEGVHPIIGLEIALAPTSRLEKKRIYGEPAGYSLVLLAKDPIGYRNLCALTSIAYLEGFYYVPRIDRETLSSHAEGLICMTGQLKSRLARLIVDGKEVDEEMSFLQGLFKDDLYLELQRHTMSDGRIQDDGMEKEPWLLTNYRDMLTRQQKVEAGLVGLGLPLVATNGTRYIDAGDWQAHEILKNVQSGEPCEIWERDAHGRNIRRIPNPKRKVEASHELDFKSPEEMAARFADRPDALENTFKVAEKCTFELDFKTRHYPVFVPPELEGKEVADEVRKKASEEYLVKLCEEGITRRYTPERLSHVKEKYPDQDPLDVVRARLDYELEVIISKGMCDYLLIVRDFIAWAKGESIPVGPGRGSGAGSIILYLIEITDIEPLRFSLFFERFINPERLSYPDIDVDICMERRSEVIDYTVKKYGKEKVAQIITFGTMKAKMAIKDVGRVLSVPLSKVNEIAKLVPEDPNMTLDKALELDHELKAMYESDEDAKRILDLGRQLEGSIRNTGIHAAGLIISGDALTQHIPICTSKDSDMAVTQYSMKPVEAVGMLKIDFLGLKTLTSIQKTIDAISDRKGIEIDLSNLPLDDGAAFDLLNHGKTQGVFQLESGGMQELAKQLHIDKFEEIIAVGALYRPGPMEMIPSFINRKHGREQIEYDHPWMQEILKETYGIMVYQEQVMQIAQELAGYSLGEGDLLRKAMGKKDHQEMQRQSQKFQTGAQEKGIEAEKALAIFNKVEKFASYGFNKAHATAYGLLSYITAYLKANHPREWVAALMTCDIHDISKVAKHIREAEAMNIPILPPDVNEAGDAFVATEKGIRFAMSGIKGVGHGVVEAIVEERQASGPFASLYDFLKRIDLKRANKKAVCHLIDAGGFDGTGWSRAQLQASLETQYDMAAREQKEKAKGVMDLFATLDTVETSPFVTPPESVRPFSKQEILAKEKELLGFYLTAHPLDDYKEILPRLSCVPMESLSDKAHSTPCRIAFIIDSVTVRIAQRSQRKFAILTISNGIEHFELPIWSDLYEAHSHLLNESQLIYAVVQVDKRDESLKLHARFLSDLTTVNEGVIKECDTAFENAQNNPLRESRRKEKPKEEVKVVDKPPITLHLDAKNMSLTRILELKKIFHDHPGFHPLILKFNHDTASVGQVDIGKDWGVDGSDEFKEKLEQLSFLSELELAK